MNRDDKLNEQNRDEIETAEPNETETNETDKPNETKTDETDKPTDSDKKGKKPYTTAVNDPDLLVTYEPIKGAPPTIKCPNCGEEMPTTIDTCVNCGHYLKKDEKHYVPMDEKKMKKIRWTIGVICIIAFVLFMIFSGKFLSN